jgi:2-keto-3-deoxy-L-rhamnonate aldolase RhmA
MSSPSTHPLRSKLATGGCVKLMSLRQLRSVDAVFILREAGFDGFYIDAEHGVFSLREIADLCQMAQACNMTALVRVHSAEVGTVGPILDCGATGLIIPHVSSRQDIQAALELAKYPPLGRRSMAAIGPASGYRRQAAAEAVPQRNSEVFMIAMIETAQGVARAEEIAATEGVDALMMGPMDLSLELGLPGQVRHESICQAYLAAAAAAQRCGKHFVAGGAGGPPMADMVAAGARLLMGGNDGAYLIEALQKAVQSMQEAAATAR